MSEIKGQLLGMLLVLAVFASVAGSLMNVFNQTSEAIQKRVDSEISLVKS